MKSVHLFFIRTPFRLQDTTAHPEDEILELEEYDNGYYSYYRIEYKDLEETFQSLVKCANTLFVLGTGNVPFRRLSYLANVLSDEECTISKIVFKTTLTKDDIDDLCEGLSKNSTVKELVVRDHRPPNIVETMTPLLQDNHTLTHLIIGDEDETPEFIQRNIRIKESRDSHRLSLFEKMLPAIEDESFPKRIRK